MNYHPEDFFALSEAVEREHGLLLEDICEGSWLRYRLVKPDGGHEWKRYKTSHCDQSALMEIPYDETLHVRLHDDDDDTIIVVDHPGEAPLYDDSRYGTPTRIDRRVRVCAVDDAVGLWPRYSGVVSDRSYQPL